MSIKGNKGEWSEIYTFLKLLSDGKLVTADEDLNPIDEQFFPILKIIREEVDGSKYEYHPNLKGADVKIYLNDEQILELPTCSFAEEANFLLTHINTMETQSRAFAIRRTENFIQEIFVNKLKAPSSDKSDINMQIHDYNTGYRNTVGFSIKSELGSLSTLLNASKSTNFIYKVEGLSSANLNEINAINTTGKIKERINKIVELGGKIKFKNMYNEVFQNNLSMIDSQMPKLVASFLLFYYQRQGTSCLELIEKVAEKNPLLLSQSFYKHKMKEMLCSIALGMQPNTPWNGIDEATGGFVIVKKTGDVLAYHIYNRDAFKDYPDLYPRRTLAKAESCPCFLQNPYTRPVHSQNCFYESYQSPSLKPPALASTSSNPNHQTKRRDKGAQSRMPQHWALQISVPLFRATA